MGPAVADTDGTPTTGVSTAPSAGAQTQPAGSDPAAGAGSDTGTTDGGPLTEGDSTAAGRAPYAGDPEAEAAYVAAEDDRLVEVRTVDTLAQWSATPLYAPYRLATGSSYTLVLTARKDPYTIADLLTLAPQTFVRQPDGDYLLSENLVVLAGATLNLSNSGGLRLLMASDATGFVSIVNYGGRLNVIGTKGAPVVISSHDRDDNTLDTNTADGRAYIRSIGGQVTFSWVELHDLGFWSGRTGGLSLTGTDRPNSGALDDLGQTMRVGKRADRERAVEEKANPSPATPGLDGKGRATLSQVLPSGDLPVPTVSIDSPEYSFVSASIMHTSVDGNAFGVFVSSANGLSIRDSSFARSLVDGVVMHRYVVNAVIEKTSASSNAGDGIMLARATTGIVLSEVTTDHNHRNGITMSGLPLAEGPSATGTSVGSYGNNSVANSQMDDNGRYGVEVIGGVNLGVLSNNLARNDTGVVVREAADKVSVVGNRVSGSGTQGIAVRDGVKDATVTGNIVTGGRTALYVRDSVAKVRRNTVTDASLHAASLVGTLGSSVLTENSLSGRGPSAIDVKRAVDVDLRHWSNDTSGWDDTTPFLVTLKRFLQPLTALWLLLGLMLVLTAVSGTRRRRDKRHPYADKAAVTDGVALVERPREGAGV
jgi:hypothetical protein